jgi:2-dehydro-3-deoxygluconokinase
MITLKNKNEYEFDCVAFGEVMLRFDPGAGRIKNARNFGVWEGGGEYNVVRGLGKTFGQKTAVVTAFADNEVGKLLEDLILQGGVDTRFIKWLPFDGIGKDVRNGLNFVERGFGVRGALSVSDRGHTAISKLENGDIDWNGIFSKTRWFHTGGICAALFAETKTSDNPVLTAVKSAKENGVCVSFDLNYRPSLWKANGGIEHCREVNREIVRYVDVLIGNEEDFTACLGFEIEGNEEGLRELNIEGYKKMVELISKSYPNLSYVASTLRTVRTATKNDWSAILWADGQIYRGINFENLEIFDRVGGGDSFASGLIYGLMTADAETALNFGIAHGALAMTTPGDTSMASLSEVKALAKGGGARIVR